jgi:CelD/BcsL family acetyltransferase involved in cellulose biosynthesis
MSSYRFAVVEGAAGLHEHIAAWDELAACAIEPNPFYESWMLLPGIEAFGGDLSLLFVFAYTQGPGGAPVLCGFFPLERLASYKNLPMRHLQLWRHRHCYLGTPLLRRGHARGCLEAFLGWLAGSRHASMMQWDHIANDGPFYGALQAVLADTGRRKFVSRTISRAVLRPRLDAESYLRESLPGSSRKEFRRLERRLSEAGGPAAYSTLEAGAEADPWIAAFLALEARGWKGRRGSAMDCSEAGRRFFQAIAAGAAQRRRLMMLALAVGGRTVAMKCNFLAHDGAFAFKIAYDEAYARFSPGTLLELENIREFHRRAELRWMDSCAASEHFMANRLWLDRRSLACVLTTTGRATGELLVSSLPLLRRVVTSMRAPVSVPA